MVKRVIAIVVAFLLALLGAVLVLLYARGADSRAMEGQKPTRVYVTSEYLPVGTTLKDALRGNKIKATELAAKGVPAGALGKIDSSTENLVALADIAPGQYLLAAAFGEKTPSEKAIDIPAGHIAISVSLQDPNRVGQFVTRGSYITIYDSYVLKKLGTDDATKQFNELALNGTSILLPKVLVIGVGTTGLPPQAAPSPNADAKDKTQQAAVSTLLTVSVTPEESIKLVGAIQAGPGANPANHLYFGLQGQDVTVDPALEWDAFERRTGQLP